MNKRILLAISGGVDSAVAALLLKKQGFQVEGMFLDLWKWNIHADQQNQKKSNRQSIRNIQNKLGLKIHVIDAKEVFKHEVISYFSKEIIDGKTPNPCIVCNPKVKFAMLIKIADQLGIENISTGHYAKTNNKPDGLYGLYQAEDLTKDQSYMLCNLTQKTLSRLILPLGVIKKEEVIRLAKSCNLKAADQKESQDLCFIEKGEYKSYLSTIVKNQPGDIVDIHGAYLGKHRGLQNFTIGQRKGIRIPAERPYYVINKKIAENQLVVGEKEFLLRDTIVIDRVHWIAEYFNPELHCNVRIRYQSPSHPCKIIMTKNNKFEIILENKVAGITPGQFAVLYDGSEVLGCGRICV